MSGTCTMQCRYENKNAVGKPEGKSQSLAIPSRVG